MLKHCEVCHKEYDVRPARILKGHGRFCSYACRSRVVKNALGSIRSEEFINRMREVTRARVGELHPLWKGESANYYTKHSWMTRHFGQPLFCEGCGTEEAVRYEWANVSGEYVRSRSDWLRLCRSCHSAYDKIPEKAWRTRRERMVQEL